MIKACVICGKEFDARNSAKCCSPECSNERVHRFRMVHSAEITERARKWNAAHPDRRREIKHVNYVAHAKEASDYTRRYRARHPEIGRKAADKYRFSDRGRIARAAIQQNRRIRSNGARMNVDTVLELKSEYGGICPYCNECIIRGHVDHIVPVSRGGLNDRSNLVWACQRCNVQKKDKTLLEFFLYRKSLAVDL